MTDDRKPRFNRDNNSYDNPYGNRGGNESRRDDRPRVERDGEHKPRFNDERRSEGRRDDARRDDRPRFERDGERKPRFNDDRRSEGRRDSRDNSRRDDRPRFERDGERKPRFNDDRRSEGRRDDSRRDDRPRFERDGERKPRFNDDRRSEGRRDDSRRDDRPRFERDGERKPRFNDDRRSEGRRDDSHRDNSRRDDRPRFERDGERKPRFNDDRRSEGRRDSRDNSRRDDRPRFERDGERKPRFSDDRRSEGRRDDSRRDSRDNHRRDERPRTDKRRDERRPEAGRSSAEKQRFDRVQDEQGNVTLVAHTPVERESAYVGGEQTLSLKRSARPAVEYHGEEFDEPEALHNGIDMEQIRRQRAEETRIYGENACQVLFANRPDVIVRGWFTPQVTPRFSDTLRWMAANRKAYHVVDAEEMAKVAGSEHHGGVCLLIKKRRPLHLLDYLETARDSDCLLALENVANPHNLGGIMRSCAHFGVRGVVMRQAANLESGAAVRTAEGGAEFLQPIAVEDFSAGLERLRQAGYTIVTTSSHEGQSVFSSELPAKVVIVFGEEKSGISDDTLRQGDLALSIPGTGHVESLNVSVATGILLAEWWRQHGVQA